MNSRNMKTVSCLAAAVMALAGAGALPAGTFESLDIKASAATVVASGECGKNCTYTLDSTGLLTISGTGAMRDYHTSGGPDSTLEAAPWLGKGYMILKIVVGSGITSIGNSSFEQLTEVTEAVLPSSLTRIGSGSFHNCENLKTINIPASVTYIGSTALRNSQWLRDKQKSNSLVVVNNILIDGTTVVGKAVIPNGVTSIAGGAFERAAEVTEVVIPSSVKYVEAGVFYNCDKLKSLTIPKTVTYVGYKVFGFYYGERMQEFQYTDVTLYCYSGSKAEEYAKKYNVHYVLLDGGASAPGNVNGDNSVNNEDLSLMQQKLAGWNLPGFNEAAADVTGDGAFNGEDVALFQQKLAGWNVQFKTK